MTEDSDRGISHDYLKEKWDSVSKEMNINALLHLSAANTHSSIHSNYSFL